MQLATHPISKIQIPESVSGVIEIQSDCVFLEAGRKRYLIVWPEGSNIMKDGRGWKIIDDQDHAAKSGDPTRLLGGEVQLANYKSHAKTYDIMDRCGGPYFETWAIGKVE